VRGQDRKRDAEDESGSGRDLDLRKVGSICELGPGVRRRGLLILL